MKEITTLLIPAGSGPADDPFVDRNFVAVKVHLSIDLRDGGNVSAIDEALGGLEADLRERIEAHRAEIRGNKEIPS